MKKKIANKGAIAFSATLFIINTLGTNNIANASTIGDISRYAITRLAGSNRYQTAMKIADQYNSGTLQNVVLAFGEDFPDSLGGNVLASKVNAPIFLVEKDLNENKPILDYIANKLDKQGTIYFLGGTGVINDDVQDYLCLKGYSNFTRIGGKDRFETNKLIEDNLKTPKGTPVFLVNADNFPDALSASSIAAINGWPIILTNSDGLSQSAQNMIKNIMPSKIYLVGGEGVLSSNIVNDINTLIGQDYTSNIVRFSGADRYETSAKVMSYFNLNTTNCVLATGDNFPDGITGGVLAAKLNAPMLLVDDRAINRQRSVIDNTKIKSLTLLGGTGVISSSAENVLRQSPNGEYGFDCASAYSLAKYQQLKAAGYSFVARYYCPYDSRYSWKNPLSAAEAKDITNAGLKIAAVYEYGGYKPAYFTYAQGKSDSQFAINQATSVGQPSGTPIYFAVDYDSAVNNNDFTGIDAYFSGVKDTMNSNGNKYKIGVYGSNTVVDHVYNKLGSDTFIWQTYAWSAGVRNPKYNIFQFQNDITVSSINIDRDLSNMSNDPGTFTVN